MSKRTREETLKQIGIMLNDTKSRTLWGLFMDVVSADLETHLEKVKKLNEWQDVRLHQGAVRALEKLTGLNEEIQRGTRPITPTD